MTAADSQNKKESNGNNKVIPVEEDSGILSEKKKGWALLVYDLKQKKLIPIKILFFLIISSVGVLLPFMTIHMKSLGISVSETAVIYGIFPPFAILAPSTMGMVADKLGNFKVLLSVIMFLVGANSLLFLVIPTGRFIDVYPVNISFALGCDTGHLILTDLDSKSCDWSHSKADLSALKVTQCGYVCFDDSKTDPSVHEESLYLLSSEDWSEKDRETYQKYRNALFFREAWMPSVTCSPDTGSCTLARGVDWSVSGDNHTHGNTTFMQVKLKLNDSSSENNVYPVERMVYNGVQPLKDVQCDSSYDRSVRLARELTFKLNNTLKSDEGALIRQRRSGELASNDSSSALLTYRSCKAQCVVEAPRSQLCANKAFEVEFDPQLTFWVYLLLRASFGLLMGAAMVLFEGAGLAVVMQYKGDLGLQRAFGVVGIMMFSPLSGALIDHFSVGRDIPDYRPAFFLYALLISIAAIGVLMVDLDFKPPAKNLLKDIRSLLKNVELDVFFMVVLLSGLYWGFIESYLFWFLEEMGGNKSLMGLTVTISSLSGIPALLISDYIFRKIGHPNVQIIGFAVYTIRLVGYSYINDPYMCLIYEAMEAITTSLMTTSAVAYSAQLGTTTTLATIQGIIGGAYYGVGRGMGSLVGGFMMRALSPDPLTSLDIGTRATFRYLGVAAFATGFFYFLFNQLYIRPRAKQITESSSEEPNAYSNNKMSALENVEAVGDAAGQTNPVFIPDEPEVRAGSSVVRPTLWSSRLPSIVHIVHRQSPALGTLDIPNISKELLLLLSEELRLRTSINIVVIMSAALRLALFSLLLVIHSARPMSVAKRQGSGQVTLCGQHTPCGWGVYDANTRQMDYFVRNICQCDRPRERCLRSGDDVSISAYVYRCVRSRPSSSAVSSASVGSLAAGRSSIDTAPNLIDMKL